MASTPAPLKLWSPPSHSSSRAKWPGMIAAKFSSRPCKTHSTASRAKATHELGIGLVPGRDTTTTIPPAAAAGAVARMPESEIITMAQSGPGIGRGSESANIGRDTTATGPEAEMPSTAAEAERKSTTKTNDDMKSMKGEGEKKRGRWWRQEGNLHPQVDGGKSANPREEMAGQSENERGKRDRGIKKEKKKTRTEVGKNVCII